MSFDYERARATAERLIAKFGQTVTLIQIINTGTEWAPTRTPVLTPIIAVDLNERIRDGAGTLTGEITRKLYVSTSAGVTPAKGDKIKIDAIDHEVDDVLPLAPGGTTVFWEIRLAA